MKNYIISIAVLALVLLQGLAVAQEEAPAAADNGPEAAQDEAPAAADNFNSCIECHQLMDAEYDGLVEKFLNSVHREVDLSCTDCHGGDSSSMLIQVAMAPEAGFIGKPDRKNIVFICDRCHGDQQLMKRYGNLRTDQLDLYRTSTHGQALFERDDTKVAVCSDCHTAHNILRVNNPEAAVYKKNLPFTCGACHGQQELMEQYGIDWRIPDKYLNGEHAKRLFEDNDLGAPVCNNCHGNHGATPPGIDHIEDVCGNCHLRTEKYYNNSAHAPAFEALGYNKCLACHNQHELQKPTDDYLDANADANCVGCHDETSTQYETIAAMMNTIIDIREMEERAGELVEDTERTTHLSMHEMIPRVEQVRTHLLTARILQHSTSLDDMLANEEEARQEFEEISAFTKKLLERSRFNKMMVVVLALFLVGFGLLLLVYRKYVLDVQYPWQRFEGPPTDSEA
jgi:predicted CXXCH cytochrome family protein